MWKIFFEKFPLLTIVLFEKFFRKNPSHTAKNGRTVIGKFYRLVRLYEIDNPPQHQCVGRVAICGRSDGCALLSKPCKVSCHCCE